MKYFKGKIKTNFLNNKIPKEDSQDISLSVILIDSVFRTSKKFCPQVFLEEWKYVIKEKEIHNYIINDAEISSDSDKETLLKKFQTERDSDCKENSNEDSSDKSFCLRFKSVLTTFHIGIRLKNVQ